MDKGKISSLQMVLLMYPTILATAILSVPSTTAKYANQDLWLSPIIAAIFGFVTVYITTQLHKMYPSETFIQLSDCVIGKFLGKLLGLIILFFYLLNSGQIVRSYSEFIVSAFLGRTPISIITGSMILLCALVVYGGIEVLGRMAQLIFPLLFIPLLIFAILISPDFEFGNILPLMEKGVMPAIQGAVVPGGWFTEFFIISFLLPFLKDKQKGMKYGIIAVLCVMITLVLVNLIVLFVLGTTVSSKDYPLMVVGRYISIGQVFENLESFIMAIWILGAFVKISVFYYVTAIVTANWLNVSTVKPLVWPIGILIVEFSFWALPSRTEVERYDNFTFPFYGVLIQTLIPLILLVIAIIKNRKKKNAST